MSDGIRVVKPRKHICPLPYPRYGDGHGVGEIVECLDCGTYWESTYWNAHSQPYTWRKLSKRKMRRKTK